MKIVMPIAGAGSRFGSQLPKPLVPVAGRVLIKWAMGNLDCGPGTEWVFVARSEHLAAWPELGEHLMTAGPKVAIHRLQGATPSPVHTLHAARPLWESTPGPLLITNCDQHLARPILPWLQAFQASNADVGALTLAADAPQYVHLEEREGRVNGVLGRIRSDAPAAAGYYFYRSGPVLAALVAAVMADLPADREPCVTDTLGQAIRSGRVVRAWTIGGEGETCIPLGDLQQVARYESKLSQP